jgi:DNA-binding Lrp family transcriptional regulator
VNFIALDARAQLIELANKVGCSSQNINYRMKKLKNNGIIQAYRVNLDLKKLGLKRFKVDIFLKEHKKRLGIVKLVKNYPNLSYFSTSIGLCDLEFEFIVENTDKLISIMDDIEKKFPGGIRNYKYYSYIVGYIETFLPEMDFK